MGENMKKKTRTKWKKNYQQTEKKLRWCIVSKGTYT